MQGPMLHGQGKYFALVQCIASQTRSAAAESQCDVSPWSWSVLDSPGNQQVTLQVKTYRLALGPPQKCMPGCQHVCFCIVVAYKAGHTQAPLTGCFLAAFQGCTLAAPLPKPVPTPSLAAASQGCLLTLWAQGRVIPQAHNVPHIARVTHNDCTLKTGMARWSTHIVYGH